MLQCALRVDRSSELAESKIAVVMWSQRRLARVSAALLGVLASSCMTFSTGGESVPVPKALGTVPPRVAVSFEFGSSEECAAFASAVAETGLFHSTVAEGEHADLTLVIERSKSWDIHFIGLVNLVLLGILPVPSNTTLIELRTKLRVAPLPDVELPSVERKLHTWGGIPLLLLSFIQVDESDALVSMSREVVAHAAREYAALHERSWAAALASDSPDDIERFVTAFAVSPHIEQASVALEERLFALFERRGDGASALRYLRAFPSGERSEELRARSAGVLWNDLRINSDATRLEEYIDLYPLGAHTRDALALLDDVSWNDAQSQRNDAARYRSYAARFPGGKHAAEVRDVLDWVAVEEAGTPSAVAGYLNAHPMGRFAYEARSALALQTDPERLAIAATLPELLRSAIPSYEQTLELMESVTYHGSVHNVAGDSSVTFSYVAEFRNGSLASYEVLSGSVELDGDAYELAADGHWYPRFERVFE